MDEKGRGVLNPVTAKWLGISTLVLSIVGMISFGVLDAETGTWAKDPIGESALVLALLMFPLMGALIVGRDSRNSVGWIFCAVGLITGIGGTAQAYATGSISGTTTPDALGLVAAWITNWWWWPLLGLILVMTLFLFPTGKLSSPRWRFFFTLGLLGTILVTALGMVDPHLEAINEANGEVFYEIANPIGLEAVGDPEEGPLGGVAFGLLIVGMITGALALIVRFVGSRGIERQQLKWFALAGAAIPLNVLLEEVLGSVFQDSNLPFALTIGALPTAAGVAILRYRLYDIDVVINRALVYGSLTAILVGIYVGIVFGFQAVLEPFTAESDLAVAASTLAVAALFRPIRSRVQGFIDRRFYRRKFDAHLTVEEFNSHLRDEVELAAISDKLVDVTRETMQPSHVSLWLRRAVP
jgi:hypothetical protein